MSRKIGMKNAVKSADMGPKRLLGQADDVRQFFLGTLVGIANGFHEQEDPADEARVMVGLRGAFRWIDSDEKINILQGPILWVPPSLHDPVAEVLKPLLYQQDDEGNFITDEHGGFKPIRGARPQVNVAFKVYTIRASNPQGYTWLFEPLIQPSADDADPLSRLMAQVGLPLAGPDTAAQIEDASKIKAVTEAAQVETEKAAKRR